VVFDFIKQSYLLAADSLQNVVQEVEGLDDKTARKVQFYTRQFVDAMAPTNFALTNPTVLQATFDSSGENLLKGLQNLLHDLERGRGQLQIRMTDLDAFKPGENIASTPGKVIFQNELLQLIQYNPTPRRSISARSCSLRPGSTSFTSWTCARKTPWSSGWWIRASRCS
jgi:polyhydroxyalkanoate synthase